MADNRPPQSRIKRVREEDNNTCQNCQRSSYTDDVELHVHHIVPLKDGGSNKKSNLITLCEECHNAVHTGTDAPTAKSKFSGKSEFVENFAYLSVLVAGKYPVILMLGVTVLTLIFVASGQRIIAVLFFICSSVFVGIMQYAKAKGEGGKLS
ncbi:HNH endonuclease [Halobellus salinus]|uniref:HNH endonuclease n=1 Tax=Halobellus salinus TaxID=931585 RepID=UPI001E4DBD0D|nr:HNH endonuclease [Halobellus salinus]